MWKYNGNNVNKGWEGRTRFGFLTKAVEVNLNSPHANIFKTPKNPGIQPLNKLPTYSHP